MNDKIVVTGIGMVTPLGIGREKSWKNLVEGRSGIRFIDNLPISAAGTVDYPDTNGVPREAGLALLAVEEALKDAGIQPETFDRERIACTVSVSKPSVEPWQIFGLETAGQHIRQKFGIEGPGGNYSAACATGIVSIHAGIRYVMEDKADVCITGSAEASLHPLYIAGFQNMGVLTEVDADPASAVKPFASDRTGFLPGEGAGILILERLSSAQQKGVHIYGAIESCVLGSDGYHPVLFNGNGMHIARVIKEAVINAGVESRAIRDMYINAHGTATALNDRLETAALKNIFGNNAQSAISSTKAGTGHLLGAAGSVEAGIALLSMRDGMVPPTLNLFKKDPLCDLNYTPVSSRKKTIDYAISLSYGFGGHIGAVLFKKY